MTERYVAFLRGINVGGKTTVSMDALRTCFEGLGFTDVKTYINSGNVLFKAGSYDPRQLESIIEPALDTAFTPGIRVVVLSAVELDTVIRRLPQSWEKTPHKNVISYFYGTLLIIRT